jgi:hypothetical protein
VDAIDMESGPNEVSTRGPERHRVGEVGLGKNVVRDRLRGNPLASEAMGVASRSLTFSLQSTQTANLS